MSFGKREAIKAGWEAFKLNWKFLLKATGIVFGISLVISIITSGIPKDLWIVSVLWWFIRMVIILTMSAGMIKIYIKAIGQESLQLSDLFTGYRLILKLFLAQFITSVSAILPVLVLAAGGAVIAIADARLPVIIAGVAVFLTGLVLLVNVSIRLMFALYFVVDREMGPVAALKASWQATSGQVINLFLFSLLLLGIAILGVLAFGLGLLIAGPVASLATAYVYKKISA